MQTNVFSMVMWYDQGYVYRQTGSHLCFFIFGPWKEVRRDGVMTLEMRISVSSSELGGKKSRVKIEKYWNTEKLVEE